jgi:3-oxoacyl-[acyl-carrier protein] reductase
MARDWADGLMIEGRVAVLTGAASGIGRETALALADAGADLMICDLDEDGLAETARMASGLGRRVATRRVDVGVKDDVDALAAAALETFGRIDIWANIAATVRHTPVLDVTQEEVERQIAVNQMGVYWGCAAAGRVMKEQGAGGAIVNVSSGAGDSPPPGSSVYAMTKAAVNMITRACALEFGGFGVRVNTVAPGFVYTPMTRAAQETDPAKREAWLDQMRAISPLGEIGQPRDIAMAILYLVSDAARFVTGQNLRPNGGVLMV